MRLSASAAAFIIATLVVFGVFNARAGGQMPATTDWHAADPMRTLTGGIQIPSGATLSIDPGTVINGNGNTLQVVGSLSAIGTPAAQIHFNDLFLQCGTSGTSAQPCDIQLENVVFDGGGLLTNVSSPGGVSLTRSIFKHFGLPADGIYFGSAGTNALTGDAFIDTAPISLNVGSSATLVSGNLFAQWHTFLGAGAAITLGSSSQNAILHGNGFLSGKSSGFIALDSGSSTLGRMIADGNYFGTADPSIVRSAIVDSTTDPTRQTAIIYQPYLTAPPASAPSLTGANPTAAGIVSAVLPTSRSVLTSRNATIFGVLINAGTVDFASCILVPRSMAGSTPLRGIAAAGFVFTETNPATNAVIGSVNAPFALAQGQKRTFVLAFSPKSGMPVTDVGIFAQCDGADDSNVISGIGSALLSFNTTPTADVIALAATASSDGIVHVPGINATGAFAVATVNVGIGAALTVSPEISGGGATATICQTIPTTGACIATPGNSVAVTIGADETPTFSVFVTVGNADIPLDAATRRVAVTITDNGNSVRGSTSVALTTLAATSTAPTSSTAPASSTAPNPSLPVTERAPTGLDLSQYTVGVSTWLDPTGQWYKLTGVINGMADWTPLPPQPADACGVVTGAVLCGGTHRLVPGYSGALFTVERATDFATLAVNALPTGAPDVTSLAAFLAPSKGVGYVVRLNSQDGVAANDMTNPTLALAPIIDMANVSGANIPLMFNWVERAMYLGFANLYTVNWPGSGNAISFTAVNSPVLPWIVQGVKVTGTNIPVNTTVTAVDYTTGAIMLSNTPTGVPANVVFAEPQPGVYLDIPDTIQVPWQSWSMIMSMQYGAQSANALRPIIMGVHGSDVASAAGNWSGIYMSAEGQAGGTRVIDGNNLLSNHVAAGGNWSSSPQIFGFALGGAGGRNLNWQMEGQQGTIANATGATPAVTLSGGAIGFSNQFANPTNSSDFLLYDVIVAPTQAAPADFTNATTAISTARGWKPQVQKAIVFDGSSTTAGAGTISPLSWPFYVAQSLAGTYPFKPFNQAVGGTIEYGSAQFSRYGGALAANQKDLIVLHAGQGNSLQQGGTLTVSATDSATGILTVSGTGNTAFAPTVHISSPANLPAGATILSSNYTQTTIQVDPAHLPTGKLTSVTVLNDTGAEAWRAIVDYCATMVASGYSRIVLVGSATRGSFQPAQLSEFDTLKTFERELWSTVPNVVGFIDLEADPEFGDGGAMTVTGVDPVHNTATVASLAPYAAANNRIYWAGMPYSLANDSGGQTVTGVTGNGPYTIAMSGSVSGLAVGSVLHAINPAPWTQYSQYWTPDHQHFQPAGYQLQGANAAQFLVDSGLLK